MMPCRSGVSSDGELDCWPSSLRTSEPRIGRSCSLQLLLGAGADVHQQRIDDPVAGEGVDLEPALVGRQDLLALHVDVLDALVDPHDLVDERDAAGDARAGGADRPAGLVTG